MKLIFTFLLFMCGLAANASGHIPSGEIEDMGGVPDLPFLESLQQAKPVLPGWTSRSECIYAAAKVEESGGGWQFVFMSFPRWSDGAFGQKHFIHIRRGRKIIQDRDPAGKDDRYFPTLSITNAIASATAFLQSRHNGCFVVRASWHQPTDSWRVGFLNRSDEQALLDVDSKGVSTLIQILPREH